MGEWWPQLGETSVLAGLTMGFAWSIFSTARRGRAFANAGYPPRNQLRWFVTSFVSMASYLTLITAVALLAAHDRIAGELAWFLVAFAALAFCTALQFSGFEAPPREAEPSSTLTPPVRTPPLEPLRESA